VLQAKLGSFSQLHLGRSAVGGADHPQIFLFGGGQDLRERAHTAPKVGVDAALRPANAQTGVQVPAAKIQIRGDDGGLRPGSASGQADGQIRRQDRLPDSALSAGHGDGPQPGLRRRAHVHAR